MGKNALIVAAAPTNDLSYVRAWLAQHPEAYRICADGGRRYFSALGIVPNLMIADFDSAERADETEELIRLKPEKDDTDTKACLREAIRRGYTELTLVCATGGRLDHELANLALCEWAAAQGARLTVLNAQNRIFLHTGGTMRLPRDAAYHYVSVVPLDPMLTGVTLTGLRYPLCNAVVTRRDMLTVSNEALEDRFTVTIEQGKALIIFSKD